MEIHKCPREQSIATNLTYTEMKLCGVHYIIYTCVIKNFILTHPFHADTYSYSNTHLCMHIHTTLRTHARTHTSMHALSCSKPCSTSPKLAPYTARTSRLCLSLFALVIKHSLHLASDSHPRA